MYKMFLEALERANDFHKHTLRGRDIHILYLLKDTHAFLEAKDKKSEDFLILNEVLIQMNRIDTTLEGNHRFSYFRSIIKNLGFIPTDINYEGEKGRVNFLLSLIKQILNFEYRL